MKVSDLMTTHASTCRPDAPLHFAAQIMWDHDCGCVPVVDDSNRIVGMLTDRDVCMAALMQGKSLSEMTVESAMSRAVYGCSPEDDVEKAAGLMRLRQVRRVPVVDDVGHLMGVISLSDFARALAANASNGVTTPTVARTLFDISQPAV
jgi:CBS domain-containing protein